MSTDNQFLDYAYDYVIVGGGSAGATLAARLSEDPHVSVALLEAGVHHDNMHVNMPAGYFELFFSERDWSFRTTPQPNNFNSSAIWPRGRVLGGCSSINAMFYVRGHRENFNEWSEKYGCEGWSYDDVLPYFRRSEHANLKKSDENYHGTDGPLSVEDTTRGDPHLLSKLFVESAANADVGLPVNHDYNGENQEGVSLLQTTTRLGKRCSTAHAFLDPVIPRRSNLAVATRVYVTRIMTQGDTAIGACYRRPYDASTSPISGHVRDSTIYARREVIVAAGAVCTPWLLQLSGIGPAPLLKELHVPCVQDLPAVGSHLQDHLMVLQMFALRKGRSYSVDTISKLMALIRYAWNQTGLGSTIGAEITAFTHSSLQDRPQSSPTDLQFHMMAALANTVPEFIAAANLGDKGTQWETAKHAYGITLVPILLQPKSRGSIRIASSNPSHRPVIDPNYLTHPDDVQLLVEGLKKGRKIVRTPPLSEWIGEELVDTSIAHSVHSEAYLEEYARKCAITIYHPTSTARMGNDPANSVVDPQLRVHGMKGLRVCDASVMPQIVSGNTNAATIMIGEKCADLVREANRGKPAPSRL